MKKQALLFLSIGSVIACSAFLWLQQPRMGTFRLENKKEDEGKEAMLAKQAMERRMEKLQDENGEFHASYYYNALKQADRAKQLGSRSALGLNWEELGPDDVGGRTRAVLIDKRDATHKTVYAGGVGGGLWKSTDGSNTWSKVSGWNQWVGVSCIAQGPGPDYTIFVGTGEGLANVGATSFNSGNVGNGIYKLVNDVPTLITPDAYVSNSINNTDAWSAVNRIAVNPLDANVIIAATQRGLYQTNDGGTSWNPITITGIGAGSSAADVKWSKDGVNIFAAVGGNNKLVQSPNGGFTWTRITSTTNPGFPTQQGRIEIAIAPSNSNIVYISVATASGQTYGVYRTENAGDAVSTWASIGNKGPLFDPFGENAQGWYDNVIAVSPANPNRVYLGGVDFFTWSDQSGWKLADAGLGGGNANPNYIHPDKHAITICDDDANLMYVGCDGGVYKSTNALSSFPYPNYTVKNRGYNVTQNYSVAASPSGEVMGGAQDNGTNYINFTGNTRMSSDQVLGGDGTYAEMSHINPRIFFAGIYFGQNYRSANKGSSFDNFYDVKVDPQGWGEPSGCGGQQNANAPFISPFWLAETKSATTGVKTVPFKADRNYTAGETISVKSATGDYPFTYTLTADLNAQDTLFVKDPVRSRFMLSSSCGIWVTSDALNLAAIPKWYRLMTTMSGVPYSVSSSKDGDVLYVGTSSGRVYRCPNFNVRCDTTSYPTGTGNGVIYKSTSQFTNKVVSAKAIEGISVDPNNSDHVVAVSSGFTTAGTAHVFETTDGGNTWTPLTNGLPNMPVYDVVVHDANTIIIASELGIWSWDGTTWNEENNNIPRMPVYRLIEKPLYSDNCSVLYAGTHGRGMWRCATFAENGGCRTTTSINDAKSPEISNISIYPNPVSSTARVTVVLDNHQDVTLRVFDMQGKLYKEVTQRNTVDGENQFDIDASGLSNGTYIVAATVGNLRTQSKLFIVSK